MAQNSKIEWTEHTANIWHGCTKVHEGCDNCYAETLTKRWGRDIWGNDKPRLVIKSFFTDLDRYQRLAKEANTFHRVFVGSMMDIFEKSMPMIDSKGEPYIANTGSLRTIFFDMINSDRFPNLIFLLLTKRPSNIPKMTPIAWQHGAPKNVWFGTSPVNQLTADKLIPQLLAVPHSNRFLSIEPQLGPVRIDRYLQTGGIHWVIQGGESGHGRRPFYLDWANDLRYQCFFYNVPYFFKQIDKVQPIPEEYIIRETPFEV